MKRCKIDRLTVVKSWKKRGDMYLGLITSYVWLWKVKMCTLINDRYYVRRRYKVSSNNYGRRRKAKMQNTKWAIDLRLKRKKLKNMKIREQIKDWKNIHAERVTVEKKKKKKRKKNQKMWSEKEKKMKKKNDGQYEHFYFHFSDFWVWDWRMLFVVLFCWNCIAEDFVAQFDIRESGTIV